MMVACQQDMMQNLPKNDHNLKVPWLTRKSTQRTYFLKLWIRFIFEIPWMMMVIVLEFVVLVFLEKQSWPISIEYHINDLFTTCLCQIFEFIVYKTCNRNEELENNLSTIYTHYERLNTHFKETYMSNGRQNPDLYSEYYSSCTLWCKTTTQEWLQPF